MRLYIKSEEKDLDFFKHEFFKKIDPNNTETNIFTQSCVEECNYHGDFRNAILIKIKKCSTGFYINLKSGYGRNLVLLKIWVILLNKIIEAYPNVRSKE